MKVSEHIRRHLLKSFGMCESVPVPSLESLRETEWDQEFERLMRNRLIMGAFRYGLLKDKHTHGYLLLDGMLRLIEQYRKTGNLEFMVDLANYALLEYVAQRGAGGAFVSVDDGDHHCRKK